MQSTDPACVSLTCQTPCSGCQDSLLTVLAINLMGDGMRDALDPKLRSAA